MSKKTDINDILSVPIQTDSLFSAIKVAGIGVWDLTLGADSTVIWDDRCKELFGIAKGNNIPYKEALKYIHADDKERVDAAVKQALDPKSGEEYDVRYRTIGADDGILRLVRFVGKTFFDENNIAVRFSGIAMDVSSEMTSREEYQKLKVLVDNAPDFMGSSNNEKVITQLNKSAFSIMGIDEKVDISTLKSPDFYPKEQDPLMREIYETVRDKGSWQGNLFLKHFKTGERIPGYGNYEVVIDPETGKILGRSTTVRDLRPELKAQKALRDSEALFRNVTQNAPTGLWMSDKTGGLIYLNKTLVDWTGMAYEDLLGAGWANAIIEEDRQKSADIFLAAVNSRTHYDVEFRITKADKSVCWCRAAGDSYEDEQGNFAGYAGFCMDIHQRVEMAEAIKESEERTRSIVNQAPVAIGVLRGKDLVVESANDTILKVWGKDASIIGKPIIKALPEIEGQGFLELLQGVYNTGNPFNGNGVLAKLEHNGKIEDLYFDFVYAPLRDPNREINGVLVIASDVTAQILSKKEIEKSEAKFRSLIEEAPIPTAVLTGRDLVIDISNEAMIKLWGKGNSILGMPLAKALPELEGQPFLKILDNIFITGEAVEAQEAKAELIVDGKPTIFYFNYAYKPLFDNEGKVYAIIDMAVDVTEQVLNKQKIVEAEAQLRSAIETAKLGTWEVHLLTQKYVASPRLKKWFGFETDEEMSFEDVLAGITDNEKLKSAVRQANEGEKKGAIDVEYTVVNKKTNRAFMMHSQGQTFFNEQGAPYLIIGTTRDITVQKKNEQELERLVQERTEELQASNEEMASTNEELEEANVHLFRSNEELGQYAYVASHDLQEPLRKIRVFAGILSNHKSLSEENRPVVEKINQSSQRMSMLIKDLLEFSKLKKSNDIQRPVDLNSVLKDIVTDFELTISEKKAIVSFNDLPTINAVPLQMNQLFYNLLSNALKFTSTDRIPEINISAKILTTREVKIHIQKPVPKKIYYHITIRDNGIGFEIEYADQIFEVFKRLHGKDVYPGSGIGLALCRRIVINHWGHLYAESEIGSGTTFNLIMPS